MKITNIKDLNTGKKESQHTLEVIAEHLVLLLGRKGFIVNSNVVNSSRIDLSYNRRSFVVNTELLGYNGQFNPYCISKKGYRRTNLPTWEQRVKFNDIVNWILNLYKVSANVKSGDFIIRKGQIEFNESDWLTQEPRWMKENRHKGYYVASITE